MAIASFDGRYVIIHCDGGYVGGFNGYVCQSFLWSLHASRFNSRPVGCFGRPFRRSIRRSLL